MDWMLNYTSGALTHVSQVWWCAMDERAHNRAGNRAAKIAAARERARIEAAVLIRVCAEPNIDGEPAQHRIDRAAEKLDWNTRRVAALWRREAAKVESWEMDELRICGKKT